VKLYDVPAPAKLNLFLHVVGRRADGYHLLQTVFRFIGLSDTLHFESRDDGAIVRVDPLPDVPADTDLTVRAARALQAATGTRQGASIALEKRIPMGGGLGGGSSDAASTLIALNRLWNTGLSRADLMRLALPLGADVPVFVFGQSAFAEGIGDVLTAVDLPPRAYLVAQPDASVPTPAIFGDPDLTRDTPCITIADFLAPSLSGGLFGRNDLEPVVHRRFPEVLRAAQWLAAEDRGIDVRMSGSGACLFAEFADMQAAVLAERKIAATMRVAGRMPDTSQAMQEPPARFRLVQASPGLIEHPLRHWTAS
jgi:4-diphosphocytidyl-2-C-methyl-D-erythritol kinase